MLRTQDIFDVIVVPINKKMKATTVFYDYGHIITSIPPKEELSREDIQQYLQEYKSKIDRIEKPSGLSRIERYLKFIRYALRLLWKKRKIKRLQSFFENGISINITTQTQSEAIAVTSIQLDGDIVLRLTQSGLEMYGDELFNIHEINVRFAVLMWRDDVHLLVNVLKYAIVFWRLIILLNALSYLFFLGVWRFTPESIFQVLPIPMIMSLLTGILHILRK